MSGDAFGPAVARELQQLVLGDELGRGIARRVHVFDLDPSRVVKIEDTAGSFQNVTEWQTWEVVKGTPLAKWFAPCRHISPNGVVLIQDRAEDVKTFPAQVPDFFTDLKLANFGRIGRQFVARDYGLLLGRLFYLTTHRRLPMRRIKRTDSTGWAVT